MGKRLCLRPGFVYLTFARLPGMTTALAISDLFTQHRTAAGHAECADRIRRINARLADAGLTDETSPLPVEQARIESIVTNHSQEYIERVKETCERGAPFIDTVDSSICEESYEIALYAVGAALSAVDAVMTGAASNAFCAVRPPGHHAEYAESMGFCLFNNVAIAARHAMKQHGCKRVFIFDWDVHHGNGTQHSFEEDPSVFFCSIHGHPDTLYPGMGYASEVGKGAGEDTTLNIPMQPGSGDAHYRKAVEDFVLPAIEGFNPDLILVSAGFDAHAHDPVGNQRLQTDSFGWLTQSVCDAAKNCCGGKVVSLLEGGYNLDALTDSVELHLRTLIEAG